MRWTLTETERFWAKVDRGPGHNGCWLWTGHLNAGGYGRFYGHNSGTSRMDYVHRWSYRDAHGSLSEDLQIDHLCRNRACVRPEHLEAVSQRENILRGNGPTIRTHLTGVCRRGHSMECAPVRSNGSRYCRECRRLTRNGSVVSVRELKRQRIIADGGQGVTVG